MRARRLSAYLIPISAFAFILVGLWTTPVARAAEATGEPFRVPFLATFSGALAYYGHDMFQAAEIVQKLINGSGGIKGRPLELYKVDAPWDDMPMTLTQVKKLGSDPTVPLIIDSGTTSQVIAAHDLVDKNKVPSFAFANSGFWPRATISEWLFRSMPQVKTAFPVMFPRIVKKWQPKTAAMVYTHDQEYAVNNAQVVREFLDKFSIKLEVEATGKAKDPDWRPQLTRVKAANVDLLFLMGPGNDTGLMVKTARDMGVDIPVIGDVGMTHQDYWDMSKGKVGTTVFYNLYDPEDPRPYIQELITNHKKVTGNVPDQWRALAADATYILGKVLNRADDLSREGIRAAFSDTKRIESLTGKIGWEGSGNAVREEVIIATWKDGEIVRVPESYWTE